MEPKKRRFLTNKQLNQLEDDIASILEADDCVKVLALHAKTDRQIGLLESARDALAILYRRRLAIQYRRQPHLSPPPDSGLQDATQDDWADGDCIRSADYAFRTLALLAYTDAELDEIERARRALARIAARLKA
jgi:hypothetical protein